MKTSILATLFLTSLSSAAVFALPQSEPQPVLGEAKSSIASEVERALNSSLEQRFDLSDSGYFKTNQGKNSDRSTTNKRTFVADSGYFNTKQGKDVARSTTNKRTFFADSGYFKTKQGKDVDRSTTNKRTSSPTAATSTPSRVSRVICFQLPSVTT